MILHLALYEQYFCIPNTCHFYIPIFRYCCFYAYDNVQIVLDIWCVCVCVSYLHFHISWLWLYSVMVSLVLRECPLVHLPIIGTQIWAYQYIEASHISSHLTKKNYPWNSKIRGRMKNFKHAWSGNIKIYEIVPMFDQLGLYLP